MTYRGYAAHIEYSDEDACFIGRVAGIRDMVGFHGDDVAGLRHAFEEAVDFYVSSCASRGEKPQKPYSGRLTLRIPPEVHAHTALMAQAHGKSLSQWAAEVLANAR
jgi:predicted HicB family RNase H-like nuclease